jgi:hypothetical protein
MATLRSGLWGAVAKGRVVCRVARGCYEWQPAGLQPVAASQTAIVQAACTGAVLREQVRDLRGLGQSAGVECMIATTI